MTTRLVCLAAALLNGCSGGCAADGPELSHALQAEVGGGGYDDVDGFMVTPQGRLLIGERLDYPPFTPTGGPFFSVLTKATHTEVTGARTPIVLRVINAASLQTGSYSGTSRYFNA